MDTSKESLLERPYKPELILFAPVWEVNNELAEALVSEVLDDAGITQDGSIGRKNKIIVASLLRAGKQTLLDPALTIACSKNNNAFSGLANGIGRSAVWNVVDALQGKLLEHVAGSGAWTRFTNTLIEMMGMAYTYAQVTHHRFTPSQDLSGRLVNASFIQTFGRLVEMNEAETALERSERKRSGDTNSPVRMSRKSIYQQYGRDLEIAELEVKQLGKYYSSHPLCLPAGTGQTSDFCAAAHRVFHNGRLDAGGRFYGPWCSMNSEQRLKCTIDGEAVVSIDLNASQPFLFSMLMGIPLNIQSNTWSDLYTEALDGKVTKDDRSKLKKVALEVIGTGNPRKAKPSKSNEALFTGNDWTFYRDALLRLVPALYAMDTEYMNSSGFISFHEAEILKQTLFKLKEDDVPAYSVHDCIIVKASDKDHAISVYRKAVNDYVKQHCKKFKRVKVMDCYPAMSVSQDSKSDYRIAGSQKVI
ncbi:MAG: hypothetical protein HWD81_06450 [Marivivens sp.]|nr:hypothetical protein [Marivivens sp.]